MTDFPAINALLFATLGIVVFAIAFSIVSKLLPFDMRKQIVEERNVAAAILAGAFALGLSWIIAATMH
jgi:uncharacterized membrane protein YjfL (UPF0719 family)